jgi:nucleoside-diphosphate-sugar epimerase
VVSICIFVPMKRIGVIGAGWLGRDWVIRLSDKQDCLVQYTNRTEKEGIDNATFFKFEFGDSLDDFFQNQLDFLFITSTLPKHDFLQLEQFVEGLKLKIQPRCRIVFTSTIGVYQTNEGTVDEESGEVDTSSVYWKFEQLLLRSFPENVIVVRLGGLIGEDRHPVKYLAGKQHLTDGQKLVNLVHKGDILRFFECITHAQVTTGIYNLVYPSHPSRMEYYTNHAVLRQLDPPHFIESKSTGKIVCSEKSRQIAGFLYTHEI